MKIKIYLKNTIETETIENVYEIKYLDTNLFGKKIEKIRIKYIIPGQLMCGELQEDEIDYKDYQMKDIDILTIR